ncbi:MAG: efflux RND transporter periplasmic adaptor subunit [Pseudomonadota bacterium]
MNFATPVVASLTLLALAGCGSQAEPAAEEVRPVWSTVVGEQAGSVDAVYSGDIRARVESKLGFRVGGKIAARLVDVGSTVRAGQVMMRLLADDAALNVSSARAQADAAQAKLAKEVADLTRAEELFGQHFISQAELDQTRLSVRQAQAQFDSAQSQLQLAEHHQQYTELKADRAGVITSITAEAGQVIAAGQTVLVVAADGEREMAISIPESRVDELRNAKQMSITLWANPDKRYQASLRELAPATDELTRTYAARIRIENPDAAIRLGMTASLHVPNIEGATAIRLPLTAVITRNDQAQVWVIDPVQLRVKTRAVQLGAVQNDQILIHSGLSQGERVVTAGANLLHDGQLVKVVASASL